MKLRHFESACGGERKARNDTVFSRMKDRLAVAALVGCALIVPALSGCDRKPGQPQPAQTAAQAAEAPPAELPAMTRPFSPGPATPSGAAAAADETPATATPASSAAPTPSASNAPGATPAPSPSAAPAAGRAPAQDSCRPIPEIDRWAAKRGLEPALVRAVALVQSGLDSCAATRLCRQDYDDGSCFQPGPGKDEGYDMGLDEIHDPAARCAISNAPAAPQGSQDWRWMALGVMQTLEAPYTFWPAAYNPEGADGQYFDVLERSGLAGAMDFSEARSCNPRFNPFNADDSVCLGTSKIERFLRAARAWVRSHSAQLGIAGNDSAAQEGMAVYVLGNMYSGLWYSRTRGADHPRCSSSQGNGDCWAYGFEESRTVTASYCNSGEGGADPARCASGQPVNNPPAQCYGRTDFIRYVSECELPYLASQRDDGARLLRTYQELKARCGRK